MSGSGPPPETRGGVSTLLVASPTEQVIQHMKFRVESCLKLKFTSDCMAMSYSLPPTILKNYISNTHVMISVLATVMLTRSLVTLIFGAVACMKYLTLIS